ncbi:MAG: transaldolase [Actinobacteria bacterium]|nr:MAG: transaldolase [Actinomycetota bacterium]
MNPLQLLSAEGTSIWLDDLSRERLNIDSPTSLKSLISSHSVVGVTTNPSIFQQAITHSDLYTPAIAQYRGKTPEEVIMALTSEDVQNACDIFKPIFLASGGKDGRVSIEVDPRLAHDTEKTVVQAHELWNSIDRPNLLIKVPATLAGLPAITSLISAGISVNVTLIFSAERYSEVLQSYIEGLQARVSKKVPIDHIHSVASFFISRVDSAVDPLLEVIGTAEALALQGVAAIANAKIAYEIFENSLKSPAWDELAAHGAHPQRPLWASTGVKNPAYNKTRYVVELIAPHTVNTMPEATLLAVGEMAEPRGNTMSGSFEEARTHLTALSRLGVDLPSILNELERDGVAKFEASWTNLISVVAAKL